MMKAICSECGKIGNGTQDELTELGWMGTQYKFIFGKDIVHVKFELCPDHADADTFMRVLAEKTKEKGADLSDCLKGIKEERQ